MAFIYLKIIATNIIYMLQVTKLTDNQTLNIGFPKHRYRFIEGTSNYQNLNT